VLRQLRQEIRTRFGEEAAPHIRMLCIDADPEAVPAATQGPPASALQPYEVLLTRLHRPTHYVKPREGMPKVESWMNPRMLYRIPRTQVPAGVRALGRLAFLDNYRAIKRRLEDELRACADPDALAKATRETGLELRTTVPRVYLVASLAGGTGGGMILDLAYTTRHVLRQLGYARLEVIGVLLLPTPGTAPGRSQALGNAYAALTELNHFAAPETRFTVRYDTTDPAGPGPVNDDAPPFKRCVLLPLPEGAESGWLTPGGEGAVTSSAMAGCLIRTGYYLMSEFLSDLGRTADDIRRGSGISSKGLRTKSLAAGDSLYQTFGMYRVLWPRRRLLQQSARGLCRRVVEHWMNKDPGAVSGKVRDWVKQQWEEREFGAEHLILRLQDACHVGLQQSPENAFAVLLDPIAQRVQLDLQDAQAKRLPAPPVEAYLPYFRDALHKLHQMIGEPDAGNDSGLLSGNSRSKLVLVEDRLAEAGMKLLDECGEKLAQVIVRLIEKPEFRLAGAEEAARQFGTLFEKMLQHHEPLVKELRERATTAYERLLFVAETGQAPKTPSPRRGAVKEAPAAEVVDLLRSYARCRYQALILQQVMTVCVGLRGQLTDQLREIGFCRTRLGELLGLLADPKNVFGPDRLPSKVGRSLIPPGCKTLDEAVQQIEKGISPDDLLALDQRIQPVLKRQFRALVQVCLGSSQALHTLKPLILHEAESFLDARLANADVVQMYLGQYVKGGEVNLDKLHEDLRGLFIAAAPDLTGMASKSEISVLALPPGPAEEQFRNVVEEALPEHDLVAIPSFDEIILYREQSQVPLATLKQVGAQAQDSYRQMLSVENFTPHARIDVEDWRPLGG
jgi:eukaryotic-like serine/threonine-protein kinase